MHELELRPCKMQSLWLSSDWRILKSIVKAALSLMVLRVVWKTWEKQSVVWGVKFYIVIFLISFATIVGEKTFFFFLQIGGEIDFSEGKLKQKQSCSQVLGFLLR